MFKGGGNSRQVGLEETLYGGLGDGDADSDRLEKLSAMGKPTLLVYRMGNEIHHAFKLRREGEVAHSELPGTTADALFLPDTDHTFTSVASQDHLLEQLGKWILKKFPAA